MADKTIVLEIQYDTDTAVKNINKLTDEIVALENEQAGLKKALKDGTITQEQYSQAIAENQNKLKEGKGERANYIKQIQAESGSLEKLSIENKNLTKERNKLNLETQEGQKRLVEINAILDKNNDKIKENSSSLEKQRLNTGNYTESIIEAVKKLNDLKQKNEQLALEVKNLNKEEKGSLAIYQAKKEEIQANEKEIKKYNDLLIEDAEVVDDNVKSTNKQSNALSKLGGDLKSLPGPLGAAQGGIAKIGQAFKALLLNPIVALIAGIVGAFIALSKALRRSEEGQNAFNKASAVLRSIMETLLDVLTKVAENIVKAFKDPKQAVKDLWEVIKINLVNRVKGLADLFVNLGSIATNSMKLAGNAIANVFRKNKTDLSQFTDALKESAVDLGKAYIQTLTGFDPDKIIEGFKKLGDEIRSDAEATKRLADAQAALDKLVRKNVVDEAKLRKDISEIRLKVAEKDKFSDEERLKLLDEAIEKEEMLLNQNLTIAKERLRIRKIQNTLHASNKEDLDEEAKLQAAVFQAEQTSFEGRKRLAAERSAIALRLNKDDEKNTDDEVKRREAALQKLRDLESESALKKIEGLEELRDKEIEIENAEFERKLENERLLAEEIELIKAEHSERLLEIDENYKEQRLAKEQEALQDTLTALDQIGEAAGALKDERIALQSELLNATISLNKLAEASEKEKFDLFAGLATSLTGYIKTVNESQFADLEAQKQAELVLAGDNVAAQERIEKDYAKRAAALKEKQFNEDKVKALLDTAIATAVAVVKSLPNIPLSVAVGALGLIQEGIIAKKQFKASSYGLGGKFALFGGQPHSQGGTDLFGTDGSRLNVERGEAAFVLKKDATAEIAALSAINESFGGRSMGVKSNVMQEGGQANVGAQLNADDIARAFENVTIVTKVTDIMTGMSKFEKVINNGVV